jgi:hypothetical protein
MAHLRVSPRQFGLMNTAEFCPRCFWYLLQLGFRSPFPCPMPGLMHNLDRFEKSIVEAHLNDHDELPRWLKNLDCIDTVDFPAKLTMEFSEYDVTLVGMPDAVFLKANKKLCLVDYKTAICKGDDDPFLPVYKTQLLGYTHLLEANNLGTVDTCALVYFENILKDFELTPLDLLTPGGFDVPFHATIHEVEIDRSDLDPLLKQLREFADKEFPPKGRRKCPHCALLQKLFDDEVLRRGAEVDARNRDSLARIFSRRLEADRQAAREGWQECDDGSEANVIDIYNSVPGPMGL